MARSSASKASRSSAARSTESGPAAGFNCSSGRGKRQSALRAWPEHAVTNTATTNKTLHPPVIVSGVFDTESHRLVAGWRRLCRVAKTVSSSGARDDARLAAPGLPRTVRGRAPEPFERAEAESGQPPTAGNGIHAEQHERRDDRFERRQFEPQRVLGKHDVQKGDLDHVVGQCHPAGPSEHAETLQPDRVAGHE